MVGSPPGFAHHAVAPNALNAALLWREQRRLTFYPVLTFADKKRLATSYANLARSRTVADGTCT